MAPSGPRADIYGDERTRPPSHRGRPQRDVGRGLGRRGRRRDRGPPRQARRFPELPRDARLLAFLKSAAAVHPGRMKLSYLWRGLPGHPLHPPLTDATIGTYTFATVAALAEVLGITEDAGAYGWWIALIAGLIFTVPTALTGLADWLTIEWRSDLWWTATYHLLAMVTATVWFALAAIFGHGAYTHGNVSSGAFVLTVIGFGFLTLGGWLGGAIVYVHGMRVLNLVKEPTQRAVAPVPHA